MKIYKTQQEVEADIKDGVLAIDGDVKFECSISIEADITAWDITAWDITAWDITARNINARNITAWDITAGDINARNINARNITARDIKYYAFCQAYENIKCKSIKAKREVHQEPICLDGELIIKEEKSEEEIIELNGKKYQLIK